MYIPRNDGYAGSLGVKPFAVYHDERLFRSMDPKTHSHAISAAYKVELSQRYYQATESAAAQNRIYQSSSLWKSDILQKKMKNDIDVGRSIVSYAGIDRKDFDPAAQVSESHAAEFWKDFQYDSTYRKMEAQGGTKDSGDAKELLAAAESYHWKKRYAQEGIYDGQMFSFVDKIHQATGSFVVSNGSMENITKSLDGSLYRVDDYKLQTMAQHQDHMDIWENVFNGTYKTAEDITNAIQKTGDTDLLEDWKLGTMTNETYEKEQDSDVYSKYVIVSRSVGGNEYEGNKAGTTAKDFWTELNYNLHFTDTYQNKRTKDDFIDNGMPATGNDNDVISIIFLLDDKLAQSMGVSFYPGQKVPGDKASKQTASMVSVQKEAGREPERTGSHLQIQALRNKISNLQKKIKAAKGLENPANREQESKLDAYKQQIAAYQLQIGALMSEDISRKD